MTHVVKTQKVLHQQVQVSIQGAHLLLHNILLEYAILYHPQIN